MFQIIKYLKLLLLTLNFWIYGNNIIDKWIFAIYFTFLGLSKKLLDRIIYSVLNLKLYHYIEYSTLQHVRFVLIYIT